MNKGWIAVPGIRPLADRTLAEQIMGLGPAIEFARGKTVLDLGCAEGMIGREFARAGATDVLGIEQLGAHLSVARRVAAGWPQDPAPMPQMRFEQAHLAAWAESHPQPEPFDVVLALGIIHKLHDPKMALAFAARSARLLLCFRAPAVATEGIVKSKFTAKAVNVPKQMAGYGFREGDTIPGVRGEAVQYWWREPAFPDGQFPRGI